jgi:hypothetical protein
LKSDRAHIVHQKGKLMFNRKRFEAIEHKLDLVYTALVVRDPGTSLAAEAYEGLRRQVIAGAQERNAHLAQLVEIDLAARRGVSAHDLKGLSTQWMSQANLVAIDDPSQRDLFEGSISGDANVEVVEPAYVDAANGRLMRQGRLRETTSLTPQAGEHAALGAGAGAAAVVPPNTDHDHDTDTETDERSAEATSDHTTEPATDREQER